LLELPNVGAIPFADQHASLRETLVLDQDDLGRVRDDRAEQRKELLARLGCVA